jgi:hypothetical protein
MFDVFKINNLQIGFLAIIHLKFAVFVEALKLITMALRIYILALSIFLAMFTNM